MNLDEFIGELSMDGVKCVLQLRHAERPKMDPDDPSFGDSLAITDEGVRTSRMLGEMLSSFKDDVKFLASPLRRTMMTAELLADGMGIDNPSVEACEELGNGTFYYDNPLEVLEVFQPANFFNACFEYFRTGRQKGFRNLYLASDSLEEWLVSRLHNKLLIAATHDCYIAAFLAAKGGIEFTRENWPRFLDGGAMFVYPDGTKRHFLVRTGLSNGICGVGGRVM